MVKGNFFNSLAKDAFFIALAIVGALSLIVGFCGTYYTARMVQELIFRHFEYVPESAIIFWNVILFAALIAAGGIAIGYAVGKKFD